MDAIRAVLTDACSRLTTKRGARNARRPRRIRKWPKPPPAELRPQINPSLVLKAKRAAPVGNRPFCISRFAVIWWRDWLSLLGTLSLGTFSRFIDASGRYRSASAYRWRTAKAARLANFDAGCRFYWWFVVRESYIRTRSHVHLIVCGVDSSFHGLTSGDFLGELSSYHGNSAAGA